MIYSEERVKNLAFQIHDRLFMSEQVEYQSEEKALARLKEIMMDFFQFEDKIAAVVVKKIMSLKKNVVEGTAEWDILYQKYFEEELTRHKL